MGDEVNENLDNKNSVAPEGASVEQKDNFSDAKKEAEEAQAQAEVKESSDALKGSLVASATATQEAKSDNYVTRQEIKSESNLNNYENFMHYITLNSPEGFENAIDTLLKEIDYALRDAKNKVGLTKAGKKTLDNAKKKLIDYNETLSTKKNKYKEGTNKEVYAKDIKNLKNMRQNVEKIKRDIAGGQRGELSDDAGYTYNSIENARSSNKAQENMQQSEKKLQQEVQKGAAILNIFNQQTHTATNFYRRIAEGQYTSADYTIYIHNSSVLNPSFQRCGIQPPTEQGIVNPATGMRTGRYIDYGSIDWGSTFQQGGLAGLIDKGLSHCNNLTPGQRETWKSLGVLAGFGAGIYGLYKFFTNKQSFWKKAGITAGAFLGTQILTGENPISLFSKFMTGGLSWDKLKNSFGNAVSGVRDSGIEASETIAPAMFSLMVFDQGTTIGKINEITQGFKADNRTWTAFYQQSINKLTEQGGVQCTEYFRTTFSDKFDEEKRNNWLASFGVTDISNPSNSGVLVYELANNATMNEIILDKFKSENGLKETDDQTKKHEFKQHMKRLKADNQVLSLAVLNQHKKDWFKIDDNATYSERPEDTSNKELLVNKVDALPLDDEIKDNLRIAIQIFYDKRTIESKPELDKFNLEIDVDGNLILESNGGYKSQINLKEKKLVGFGNGIHFTDLADLLNTADLANKILETQKDKIPTSFPAFQYKIGRKGICFNDAQIVSLDVDTRVLSTGWKGATSKIDTLHEHPDDFATYLSDRRESEHKIDINPTQYPTVESLSKKEIIFTNEQEIKDLENWLQQIKEGKKFAIGDLQGDPFKISRQFKKLGNRLVFTAVDGTNEVFEEDISTKFPTIMSEKNQKKFIDFMNDKDNGMWGSAITNH